MLFVTSVLKYFYPITIVIYLICLYVMDIVSISEKIKFIFKGKYFNFEY